MSRFTLNQEDKNIFLRYTLRAEKAAISPTDSWLLSQIGLLQTRGNFDEIGFASELLFLLKNNSHFSETKRVCFAKLVPDSAMLKIIDSASSLPAIENSKYQLEPGYWCFINTESSLFSLKPGEARVFSNVNDVFAAFESDNKPIQRSVSMIGKMGFKSGLAIPVFQNLNMVGVLFLNSQVESYFDGFTAARLPVLVSLYGLAQNVFLSLASASYARTLEPITKKLEALPLTDLNLNKIQLIKLGLPEQERTWNLQTPTGLIPIKLLAKCLNFIFCTLLDVRESIKVMVLDNTKQENPELWIKLQTENSIDTLKLETWVKPILTKCYDIPIQMGEEPNEILLAIPYESLYEKGLLYSI